jgi:CDP-diglyceride synthetase
MVAAFCVALWNQFGSPHGWGLAGGLVFSSLLFGEMLISKAKLPFEKILVCLAAGLLIPYLLCALVRLRNMDIGRMYICLPLVLAFMSDTCAYFVGKFLGKHKLAPTISPKKTIEGFFGGIASQSFMYTVFTASSVSSLLPRIPKAIFLHSFPYLFSVSVIARSSLPKYKRIISSSFIFTSIS